MLKIKDNVDLKELEKFSELKIYYDTDDGKISKIYLVDNEKTYSNFWLKLAFNRKKQEKSKGLFFNRKYTEYEYIYIYVLDVPTKANWYNKMDLLYDLIKADLVEKVDD